MKIIDKSLNYGRHLIHQFAVNQPASALILDLGAGHGDDLLIFKHNNPSSRLHAVECYPPYIKDLEAHQIVVHNLNIERDVLPFDAESVDVVICNQILEHCKEVWWILHEISRVLKVGGHIVIGVPNLASLHNRLLLVLGEQPTSIQNNSAHVRGYTKKDVLKLLVNASDNSYVLADFGGSNFYPFPPALAKPLARFFPTMAWAIFFKLRKQKAYHDSFLRYPLERRLETNFFLG